MSDSATEIGPPTADGEDELPPWRVRRAVAGDLPEIAKAVTQLLTELGGKVPAEDQLYGAAQAVLASPDQGVVLVAQPPEGGLTGVLAASWQHAIHVPGRYCIVQDLWVDPSWRSRRIGAALLSELFEQMRERGVDRVEVGLPSERFAGLADTEAFYRESGFLRLGPRMRLVLA